MFRKVLSYAFVAQKVSYIDPLLHLANVLYEVKAVVKVHHCECPLLVGSGRLT